jgi:hypothetical protein
MLGVANTRDPLSLRLEPAFHARLQAAADRMQLPKHTLAQVLLGAGVDAIEAHDGAVFPVEFELVPRRVPAPSRARKTRKSAK